MALKKLLLLLEIVIIVAVVTNSTFYQVSAQSELSQLNVSIINCQTSVTKLQMLLLSEINGTTENMPSTTTENSADTTIESTTDSTTESMSNATSETSSDITLTSIESTTETTIVSTSDITTVNTSDTPTDIPTGTPTDITTTDITTTDATNAPTDTPTYAPTDDNTDATTDTPANATTTVTTTDTLTDTPTYAPTDTPTNITFTVTATDTSTNTPTDTPTNITFTVITTDTSTENIPIETTIGPALIIFHKTINKPISQQNKWGKRVDNVLANMDAILSDITENPYAVNSADLELQNHQMNILVTLGENLCTLVYGSDQAFLLENSDKTLILVNESLIAVQNASNPLNSSTTLIIWLVSVLLLCIIICIALVVWKPWKKTATKDKDIPKWRDPTANLERTSPPQGHSVNTQAASGIQNQGFVRDLEIEESNFAKLSIPRPVTIPMTTRNVQQSGNLNRSSLKSPEPKIAPLPKSYKSYT